MRAIAMLALKRKQTKSDQFFKTSRLCKLL